MPRPLPILLTLGLLLRLSLLLTPLPNLPDQTEYLALATNLLHHHTLSFTDPRFHQTLYAYRTPGYPLFLTSCLASPTAARIAQSLLDTSTILATYLTTKRLTSSSLIPLLAAALVAFNPLLIYFSTLLLSETLFTTLLAWSLYFAVERSTFNVQRWMLSPLLLSLSVLTRPSALLLPLLLPPLLGGTKGGTNGGTPPPSRRVLRGVLGGGLCIIILLPWLLRNHSLLHTWTLTTNSGITLYDGFNPQATGASDQSSLPPLPPGTSEVDRNRLYSDLAKTYIKQHPLHSLYLTLPKIARTWIPIPLSTEYHKPLYLLIGYTFTLPLLLCSLAGLAFTRIPCKLLLITPALYFTLIHATSVGSLRYRIPVEPQLAILAAFFLSSILHPRSRVVLTT